MRVIIICFIVFTCAHSYAQKLAINKSFSRVPLGPVLNYSKPQFCITDFRGKPVVLSFLSTGCSSCLKSLKKIDSLQKKFAGKVQFVLVYREAEEDLQRFFKQHDKIKLPKVPAITSAARLFKLLPFVTLQANVWIDEKGIVRYITMDYSVTAGRLESFLAGKPFVVSNLHVPSKNDYEPMINFMPGEIMSYSYVGHCKEGRNIGTGMFKDSQTVRVACNCMSVVEICKKAFEEGGRYRFNVPGSIELRTEDSFRLVRNENEELMDEWVSHYCFNYEWMGPLSQRNSVYGIMQRDVSHYFNVDAQVEKQEVPSLVLVRTSEPDQLKTKGGEPVYQLYQSTDYHPMEDSARYLRNEPFEILGRILKGWVEHGLGYPFFDETHYFGRIDIEIDGKTVDHLSLPGLRKALQAYGLDLVEEERPIDVLVIREKKRE